MSATTRILSLCLLVSLAAASLYGQGGAYGTILGTVEDNSGAVVAKASVDVTNVATNVTKHTETTSSGDFTVPYLTPGTYRVNVFCIEHDPQPVPGGLEAVTYVAPEYKGQEVVVAAGSKPLELNIDVPLKKRK